MKVDSGTQIMATAPAGTGTVDFVGDDDGGTSAKSAADEYAYQPPDISSISPTHGPAVGGTTLPISGVNFSGATAVDFGSTPATSFAFKSDGQITATSPVGSGGTYLFTITASNGASPMRCSTPDASSHRLIRRSVGANQTTFTVGGSSRVTGRLAAVDGSGFRDGQSPSLSDGGGTVRVTFTDDGGTSNGMPYSYDAPSITSISPTHGPALGGTMVTISGVNLSGVTGVKFGSTPATGFSFKSDGQITATSPAGDGTASLTGRRRRERAVHTTAPLTIRLEPCPARRTTVTQLFTLTGNNSGRFRSAPV